MKAIRFAVGSFLFVAFFATASMGQLQRTFVSGLGSDGNPCSRTAPCRTFTRAISQTNAAGEVYVLDSAGYGAFSINKAISIVAPLGVTAGISVFSGDGIDINAGGSDSVTLRGLTVNNQGSSGSGIVLNTGGTLRVESCVVRGFTGGNGIIITTGGNLVIRDTAISDCNKGIHALPNSGTAYATIDHVTMDSCVDGVDIFALDSGFLGAIRDSSISRCTAFGIATAANGQGAAAFLDVERCLIANGATGLATSQLSGGNSAMSISNCVISHNSGQGFLISAGTIYTRGNNTFAGNGDNFGSLTPLAAQ